MGDPAGRRVSRDTAMDGRSRRAYGARPVVRACRAKARHRGVGAKAFWLLCRFCKVTRRKAGTLSGRCRSNGYVLKSRAPSPRLSRRRGNRLGDAEDTRRPVCCATARRRRRGGPSYRFFSAGRPGQWPWRAAPGGCHRPRPCWRALSRPCKRCVFHAALALARYSTRCTRTSRVAG
ncbi:MAG: hypothetical protein ACFWT5_07630 [Pseudomonas helleri]